MAAAQASRHCTKKELEVKERITTMALLNLRICRILKPSKHILKVNSMSVQDRKKRKVHTRHKERQNQIAWLSPLWS